MLVKVEGESGRKKKYKLSAPNMTIKMFWADSLLKDASIKIKSASGILLYHPFPVSSTQWRVHQAEEMGSLCSFVQEMS